MGSDHDSQNYKRLANPPQTSTTNHVRSTAPIAQPTAQDYTSDHGPKQGISPSTRSAPSMIG